MGCWNGTCGISQLPIFAGEKVKCIITMQRYQKEALAAGTTYCTDYFAPLFFPITGEYDDYGSVYNIENDENSRWILKRFRGWLGDGTVEILPREQCEINDPRVREFTCLEDVLNCIERGALIFNVKGNPYLNRQKISMFMVIESIYNDLLELAKKDAWLDRWIGADRDHFLLQISSTTEEQILYNLGYDKPYMLSSGETSNISDEHYEMLKEVFSFNYIMNELRKSYLPGPGKGSHGQDFSYYRELNKSMEKYMVSIETEDK